MVTGRKQPGQDRRWTKQATRRRQHADKYADRRTPDAPMQQRLARLTEHFTSEERADERRD